MVSHFPPMSELGGWAAEQTQYVQAEAWPTHCSVNHQLLISASCHCYFPVPCSCSDWGFVFGTKICGPQRTSALVCGAHHKLSCPPTTCGVSSASCNILTWRCLCKMEIHKAGCTSSSGYASSKCCRIKAKRKEKKTLCALISLNEKRFTAFHSWSVSFHFYSNGNYCSSLLTKKSFNSFHIFPYFKYLTTYWFDSLAAFLIEELEFEIFLGTLINSHAKDHYFSGWNKGWIADRWSLQYVLVCDLCRTHSGSKQCLHFLMEGPWKIVFGLDFSSLSYHSQLWKGMEHVCREVISIFDTTEHIFMKHFCICSCMPCFPQGPSKVLHRTGFAMASS